jgi:hypothetical protein
VDLIKKDRYSLTIFSQEGTYPYSLSYENKLLLVYMGDRNIINFNLNSSYDSETHYVNAYSNTQGSERFKEISFNDDTKFDNY